MILANARWHRGAGLTHSIARSVIIALIGLTIVAAGVFGLLSLAAFKVPPKKRNVSNQRILVQGLFVSPETKSHAVEVFGAIRAAKSVALTPEVSGRVVHVHPRLKAGEVIAKGELLVGLDKRRYSLKKALLKAKRRSVSVKQKHLIQELSHLKILLSHSKALVKTAVADAERLEKLFKNRVATSAEVDAARRQELSLRTKLIEIQGQIDLVPIQSKELLAQLEAIEAELQEAQLDLEQTELRAPFRARVVTAQVEVGDFLTAARSVMTLSLEARREIAVHVTGRQLQELQAFESLQQGSQPSSSRNSEGAIELSRRARVSVLLQGRQQGCWLGRIDRIEAVDPKTRMSRIIIDLPSKRDDKQPLVLRSGMFCRIELPGKLRKNVARIPRDAIENQQIMIEAKGQLRFLPVQIVRILAHGEALVTGLSKSVRLITTKIPFAIEGMAVEFQSSERDQSSCAD